MTQPFGKVFQKPPRSSLSTDRDTSGLGERSKPRNRQTLGVSQDHQSVDLREGPGGGGGSTILGTGVPASVACLAQRPEQTAPACQHGLMHSSPQKHLLLCPQAIWESMILNHKGPMQ